MTDKKDELETPPQRILTAAERREFLGGVNEAVEEAFEVLRAAGITGAVICATTKTNEPRQPAAVTRMYREPSSDLTPKDLAMVCFSALKEVLVGAPLPRSPPGDETVQ